MNTSFAKWVDEFWLDKVVMWAPNAFRLVENKSIRFVLVMPTVIGFLLTTTIFLIPNLLLMFSAILLEIVNEP